MHEFPSVCRGGIIPGIEGGETRSMTDRRDFLATLAGGTALLLPFSELRGETRPGRAPSDVALLNIALELEHTAIYAYGLAAGSGLLSKGVLDPATGIVTWNLNIPPGETQKVVLTYTIKYPKNKTVKTKKYKSVAAPSF